MHSFKTLLITLPFLLQATAAWYVDFFAQNCEGVKPGMGTMTIYGKDEEEKECIGGPLHDKEDRAGDEEATPLDVSESVNIDGITNTDLVVDLYAARDPETGLCLEESWLTQIESDSCYTSSEGDPVKFARIHKK
ncbi:MAG: hypothetical protein Q9204_009122 [Flavoplaca sp. TL-2023a]